MHTKTMRPSLVELVACGKSNVTGPCRVVPTVFMSSCCVSMWNPSGYLEKGPRTYSCSLRCRNNDQRRCRKVAVEHTALGRAQWDYMESWVSFLFFFFIFSFFVHYCLALMHCRRGTAIPQEDFMMMSSVRDDKTVYGGRRKENISNQYALSLIRADSAYIFVDAHRHLYILISMSRI